ncbi:hypothetical protein RDV64_22085 [Acuticoccus sp. MNP-M23]|uniref:hypothetical protein n=1 Tax=Acuticoccus sp. MNP-M23 TaxID=3072793 RepID=UPI002816693F|nr:hypothetical protein [Acuticoccus sp. MNP-M23]WMS42711.1 hypothetical protein RDV64_22085 [Acuticoccus sp. MNP-M23]
MFELVRRTLLGDAAAMLAKRSRDGWMAAMGRLLHPDEEMVKHGAKMVAGIEPVTVKPPQLRGAG